MTGFAQRETLSLFADGRADARMASAPTRIISLSGDLAFGNVTMGTSAQRTLTIDNTGNSTLTVSRISYPGGFSGNWSAGTIAAGGLQNVVVTFSPSSAISYGGDLTVSSDKTSGAETRAVSGTGTPVPSLGIRREGTNIVFSWPTNAVGFTLESTANIGTSAIWNPVSPSPVVVSGQNVVSNSMSGQRQFYRLKKP